MTASLRPATPADAAALSRLATDSFVAAFGHLYRPEDLQAFLEEYRSVERARGAEALQLSVFSENFGAQRFYERYGFEHVADIDFWVGNHRDDEFLYELAL